MSFKVAVLDDYQHVAQRHADWSGLRDAAVTTFGDHIGDAAALVQHLKPFDVVCMMRERTPITRDIIGQLPNLKLIVTTGMRNASLDVAAATERGIVVCGTGGTTHATPELTWGLILALMRRIPWEDRGMKAGGWQTTVGRGLQGRTLGLLGLGRLGGHVATVGKAFGMKLIAWSPNLTQERAAKFDVTLVAKEELFSRADVVTVHLVLGERSRGVVGARELGQMQKHAYLVNTSRGPIVQEQALLAALQARQIAGAGLDVYDNEPLPKDHPLRKLDNVVLTPHLGYVTDDTYDVFYRETVEDIAAWQAGKPIRVISP
jgi:phosphoglycerate dehydrogenase-like enzyme